MVLSRRMSVSSYCQAPMTFFTAPQSPQRSYSLRTLMGIRYCLLASSVVISSLPNIKMKASSLDAFIVKGKAINVKYLCCMLINAYSVYLRKDRNSADAGENV